jgi:uracil-DNA glycosylase family 4
MTSNLETLPVKKAPVVKSGYPEIFTSDPPKELNKNRSIDGVLHLAGVGPKPCDLMVVSTCALEEETSKATNSRPMFLKGPQGNLFQRLLRQCGVLPSDIYYTALCKYTLPRGRKLKPKAADIRWNQQVLDSEIEKVSPKLVLCLGKPVFDAFVDFKSTLRDVQGGFFYSKKYDCTVYPMDMLTTPYYKPEFIGRFLLDLKTAVKHLKDTQGVGIPKIETHYAVINTMTDLVAWVALMLSEKISLISVDCEWGGVNYMEGSLRSIQICWKPGHAVYLQFRNQQGDWSFDGPLTDVVSILKPFFNDPKVKFIGHNITADFLWMEHHLEVQTHQRCAFDTMFAEYLLDEYADIKLERLALKYTDLGRYDTELFLSKKKLKIRRDEGYERIPDEVLIPYACKDVDVVMRAYPILLEKLQKQELDDYYFNISLPYVTDVFTTMSRVGLPVNRDYLDTMRDVFINNEALLMADLRIRVKNEATGLLGSKMAELDTIEGTKVFAELLSYDAERFTIMERLYDPPNLDTDFVPWDASYSAAEVLSKYSDLTRKESLVRHEFLEYSRSLTRVYTQAWEAFKAFVGPDHFNSLLHLFEHWWAAHEFNIRSDSHKRRWLFQVKGFTPIKTTKKDGMQMPWDKVLQFDAQKQQEFSPATDRETIKILSEKCPLVTRVLELGSVGTIVKSFLRPPDKEGNEQGLHKWICKSDERLHCNFACTETGRPRSWNPNVLNYPKAVTKPIEAAFKRLGQDKPYSLRSCVQAPEGWCLVDADLETAEVVSLAYIAGDEEMIAVCTSLDENFVGVDTAKADAYKIPWLRFKGVNAARTVNISDSQGDCVLADAQGMPVHPLRDMHWEMAEIMTGKDREGLDPDVDRTSGKIGMFSIPYGASPNLLERTIESMTGSKPEEGLGQKLIDAYETKFPVAAFFLRSQEAKVENPGYYRSISGRVRHFHTHGAEASGGISDYAKKSMLAPLMREARNYPMQEIVAATMARASTKLLNYFVTLNMRARPMILLHDALTVLTPIEERWQVKTLLEECMSNSTTWEVNGRILQFGIDVDFATRWGMKLTKDEESFLYSQQQ